MADLAGRKRSEPVRVIGSDPVSGAETNFQAVSSDNDAHVVDTPHSTGLYKNLVVGTSAVELKVGASKLAGRKIVSIQPKGKKIYYGYDNSVTTSSGTEVFKNQSLFISVGPNQSIWLIGNQSGINVRITES